MIIGEWPIDGELDLDDKGTFSAVISTIKELPPAITARSITSPLPSLRSTSETSAGALLASAMLAVDALNNDKGNASLLIECLDKLRLAADAHKTQNPLMQACLLAAYTEIAHSNEFYEQCISAAEEVIPIWKEHERFDQLFIETGRLYDAIVNIISIKTQEGADDEVVRLSQKASPLIQEQGDAYNEMQGSLNMLAHRVEQGEGGFSTDEPVGTGNIQTCVVIIIRDPSSKKVGILHVTPMSSISSLEQTIRKHMPNPIAGTSLQVSIIGAFGLEAETVSPQAKQLSEHNLKKALTVLSHNLQDIPIKLESSLIANLSEATNAIVVDPKTFLITEEMAGFNHPGYEIAQGLSLLLPVDVDDHPLRVAFDYTISSNRAPFLITEKAISYLSYMEMDEGEMYKDLKEYMPRAAVHERVHLIGTLLRTKEAHIDAIEYLSSALDKRITAWNTDLQEKYGTSVNVSEEIVEMARDKIASRPIYIGGNANKLNQPLIDAINELKLEVKEESKGVVATFNIDLLDEVDFPKQPLDVEIAESPKANAAQLIALARYSDVTVAILDTILQRVPTLQYPEDRSEILVELARSEKVTPMQLNRIARHVNTDDLPNIEHRRAVVTAITENAKCTQSLRNDFQPFGIYNDENQGMGSSLLKLAKDSAKGFWNKSKKMAKQIAQSPPPTADVIQFTSQELAALAERYGRRAISINAKVAVMGSRVNGIVIGRNDTGDYLVQIPTSPLTRAKFQWVPRQFMAGERPTLNQEVNFRAGAAEHIEHHNHRRRWS